MLAARLCRRPRRDEAGFSLVEAVVSAMILGVGAAVVGVAIIGTLRVTTDTGRRSAAAELAASQVESIRQLAAYDIPDGSVTLPSQTVGGITYTLTQTSTYVSYTGAVTACTGTGKLTAKRVTVTVTWPGMGSTAPVTSETLRGLGLDSANGGLDTTKGTVAVYAVNTSGDPISGAQVTIKNGLGSTLGTQVTGTDGCAVFTNLTPATNVYASVSKSGYVELNGYDTITDSGSGVVANTVVRATLQLDRPGTLGVTMTPPTGTDLPASYSPASYPLYVTTSLWPSITSIRKLPDCGAVGTAQACTTATSSTVTTVTRLLPGAYGLWFGSCLDAKPSPVPLVSATAAGTANVTVALAGVQVAPYSAGEVGRTVTATHAPDSGCPAGQTVTLGPLPAVGSTVGYALPAGVWSLSIPGGTHPQSATLVPGSATPLTVG